MKNTPADNLRLLALTTVFAFSSLGALAQNCGIPGKDGASSITGTVNTYYPPASTGTINTGSTSVSLGSATGAAGAAAPGDLFLIIQMQCETINTTDSNAYGGNNGTGSGYTDPAGSCLAGQYEYLRAGPATTATSLDLSGSPLAKTYVQDAAATTNRRTYQVIRVPQYSSTTLTGAVTAPYWNGNTGGVVALDVTGTLNMGGQTIDVSGRGFRGGGGQVWDNTAATTAFYVIPTNTTNNVGAFKGEGIAGTPAIVYDQQNNALVTTGTDYANGGQGRGAPGNAGGGGNNFNGSRDNAGGGGGGNGAQGGFGGYGWSGGGWPAGTTQDLRGIGGAAFTQRSANRIVMGGGGGAGGNNNSAALTSSGGAGGGIVMVRAGTITGTGTINASGAAGQTQPNNDAAGGGGAGGSVIVNTVSNTIGSLTINATGGVGGNGFATGNVAHAGGGGGAGGVVFSDGLPAGSLAGGANGITNVGDCPTTGVAPCSAANGATTGGNNTAAATGTDNAAAASGGVCLPNLTVTKATSTPTITATGATTATYTITVANSAGGAAIGADITDSTLPPGWTWASTTSVTFTPALSGTAFGGFIEGATPGVPAVAGSPGAVANLTTNGAPNTAPVWNNLTIPGKGNVVLQYTVNIPAAASAGTYHNPAGVKYVDPTRSTAGREITPFTDNTANRAGSQVGGTTNVTYETGASAAGNVPGSNYNGLVAGATTENVTLQADLQVTKTHTPASLPVSGAALAGTYTVVARNNGRAIAALTYATNQATDATVAQLTAAPFTVTDTLPTGFTLNATPIVTGTDAANWTCAGAVGATSFTCTRSTNTATIAAASDLVSISVPVRVDNTACPGPRVNTAVISTAAIGESDTANNSSADSAAINCVAALAVTKTDGRTTALTGDTVTYTITLSNAGPAAADGTLFQDASVATLTKTGTVACTYAGGATGPAAPTITQLEAGFAIASLPTGGSVSCAYSATVN